MDDKSEDEQASAESVGDENPVDEPAVDEPAVDDATFGEEEFVADQATASRPARLPFLVAVSALLVSLIALAGVAWLTLFPTAEPSGEDTTDAYLAAISDSIRANEQALDALERQIAEVAATRTSGDSASADIAALERRLTARLSAQESIPGRVTSLEGALSALRGISTGARDAWLLAEAEYYLQIANAQLELAGNPLLAKLALDLADERLVELGDPGLTDVRRSLSNELRSLETLETPDLEGATLTLASLSRVVDSLPIRREILTPDVEGAATDTELTGSARAVETLRNALSGVVSVRRTDEAARPLIAPDAVYFLRANLALQLQAARLALLRGEQALFRQSLDDATAWLREYYDIDSAPVKGVLRTIAEIRESSFDTSLPDISESLRLLRQYIAFRKAADASDDAAANGVPDADAEPER